MSQERNLTLPGHMRYQPKNLKEVLGYDNTMIPVGEIEIASLEVLGELGFIPAEKIALLTPEKKELILAIRTMDVDDVERKLTGHDIRAWIKLVEEIVGPELAPFIHVFLTSYDPLSTAYALHFLRSYEVLAPCIADVITHFGTMIKRDAEILQIGRTHGQHALPITVGFWLATILYRICYNAEEFHRNAMRLRGKISGAVGAYNAQFGLGVLDRCDSRSFEKRVLEKVGLKPAPISTQILCPESFAYFLHSAVMLSGSFAQFGRDCRNLMRSEIEEVSEPFGKTQSGSSTMAQKRNPITFEQSEGMFIKNIGEFLKVMMTLISEHQRDLVGSSVTRDFLIIPVNLATQLNALLRPDKETGVPFLLRIRISPEACRRNFEKNANVILAEPMYIALQMAGYKHDAHKLINHTAVPTALQMNVPLIEIVEGLAELDEELAQALSAIPPDVKNLLHHPENYTGLAKEKALQIVEFSQSIGALLAA